MWRVVIGLFVIAHGLVTAGIWAPDYSAAPAGQVQPPNPSHSWIFGDVRTFSLIFGVGVGLAVVLAGVGFLVDADWWPQAALASGVASIVMFAVFFTPWWLAGIAISMGLTVAALRADISA